MPLPARDAQGRFIKGSGGASGSSANFSLAINRFIDKIVPEQIVLFQKAIVLKALQRLIEKTPVDTGHARANWQVTIGQPALEEVEGEDKAGGSTIQSGVAAVGALGPFELVILANNVPYIEILENGGFVPKDPGPSSDPRPDRTGKVLVAKGYSTQAPRGMLRVTFEELKAEFR